MRRPVTIRPTLLDDIIALAEYCSDEKELRDYKEYKDNKLHIYMRARRVLDAMTRS